MKFVKFTLIIILTALSGRLFAVTPFPNDANGQYVYYHDQRRGTDRLTGYLKFNQEVACRTLDLKTKRETIVVLKFKKDKDNLFEVSSMQFLKGNSQMDVMMFCITDIMNFILRRQKIDAKKFPQRIEYGDGDFPKMTFDYWVPLLNLNSIWFDKSSQPVYKLVKVGILRGMKDFSFFNVKPLPKKAKGPDVKLKKQEAVIVSRNKLKYTVDKNWQKKSVEIAKNVMLNMHYLAKGSKQDAVLFSESIPLNEKNKAYHDPISFFKFSLRRVDLGGAQLLPDTVRFFKIGDRQAMYYEVQAPINNMITSSVKVLYLTPGKSMTILSLSGFKTVYMQNKEYFHNILKGATLSPKPAK